MKAYLRRKIPRSAWLRIAAGKHWMQDMVDALLGRRAPLVPPRRSSFIGSGDFQQIGSEFLSHFRSLCGLQPHHRVLDVGSGIGRMAIPLTSYLSPQGTYEGFDVVPRGIEWCSTQITPRFPNFRFVLADIQNQEYNPQGAVPASNFRFPYPDSSFDLVFLTSVFTHLRADEVENYMMEIARVLRPGGCSLITWFVLNDESKDLLGQGRSTLDFQFRVPHGLTVNRSIPEEAVAYEESFVRQTYRESGLSLQEPIRYGSWCGRSSYLSLQDICIARKSLD